MKTDVEQMAEGNGRLSVDKKLGEAIRRYRHKHQYTIVEFLRLVQESGRRAGLKPSMDNALISRLEKGRIASTRADNLRAIALAMGFSDVSQMIAGNISPAVAPLRIGAIHAIFAAPLFAAVASLKIPGASFTSFGFQEGSNFKPVLSTLDPNGAREVAVIAPNEGLVDSEHYTKRYDWEPRKIRLCTAPEIESLWNNKEIDVACISREVFQSHLGPKASREGIVIGTICQNARGANVIALIDPFIAFKGQELSDRENLKTHNDKEKWPPKTVFDTLYFLRSNPKKFIDTCEFIQQRTKGDSTLQVMCPDGTFAAKEVERLSWIRLCGGSSPLGAEPHSLANYEVFLQTAFERVRDTGIVMLTLWEPYSSYLRTAWEADVDKRNSSDPLTYDAVTNFTSELESGRFLLAEDKYNFSVDYSLSNLFRTADEPFIPFIPMDLIVARDYLEKGEASEAALLQLIDSLDKTILELRKNLARISDDRNLLRSNPESISEKISARASEPIRYLSQFFNLTPFRIFDAVSKLEFGLSFDRSFVNYLIKYRQR